MAAPFLDPLTTTARKHFVAHPHAQRAPIRPGPKLEPPFAREGDCGSRVLLYRRLLTCDLPPLGGSTLCERRLLPLPRSPTHG